MMITITSVV